MDPLILERALRLIKEIGVGVGIHGPWRDIALASPRESIRRAGLKIFRKCIEFARKLEADYFNFHICTREAVEYDEVYRDVMQAAMISLKEICRMCREAGVTPSLENNPTDFLSSLAEIRDLVLETEQLTICLDVGHLGIAKLESRRKRRNPGELEEWIRELGSKILVVHLHDYKLEGGRGYDHLLIGKGELDLNKLAELLKRTQTRYVLLEIFWSERGKRISMKELRNLLNSLRSILG